MEPKRYVFISSCGCSIEIEPIPKVTARVIYRVIELCKKHRMRDPAQVKDLVKIALWKFGLQKGRKGVNR